MSASSTTLQQLRPPAHRKAKENIMSAARELGSKAGYEMQYGLIFGNNLDK